MFSGSAPNTVASWCVAPAKKRSTPHRLSGTTDHEYISSNRSCPPGVSVAAPSGPAVISSTSIMDSISSRYAACAAVRSASRPLATNVAMAVSSAVARVCSVR